MIPYQTAMRLLETLDYRPSVEDVLSRSASRSLGDWQKAFLTEVLESPAPVHPLKGLRKAAQGVRYLQSIQGLQERFPELQEVSGPHGGRGYLLWVPDCWNL